MQNTKQATAIVLLNLGGPDSIQAVRPFLYNLFSDRDIIRLGPALLQKPLAWLISTLRAKHTAEMYSQIGGKSPILDITTAQARSLEDALNEQKNLTFKVYVGMRYWHPFTSDTIKQILSDGIRDVIVLSLYPHYSKATTGSSVDDFKKSLVATSLQPRYIEHWYDFPDYIDALARVVSEGASEFKGNEYEILYSAHSLPQSFIDEGDPYLDHIKKTIEKLTDRLSDTPYNIKGIKKHLSFQSKTGPVKWLEPSTEETISRLSRSGCRNLLVVPVSFVSDHIETLYEIDIMYKELAEQKGINMKRCKALNTSDMFIKALKNLVMKHS